MNKNYIQKIFLLKFINYFIKIIKKIENIYIKNSMKMN